MRTRAIRYTVSAFLLFLIGIAGAESTAAQPFLFGSMDDAEERGRRAPWLAESSVGLFGGFSLIGPQWHSGARITVQTESSKYSSKFSFGIRAGQNGIYDPDVDEIYDLARVVEHLRFQNEQTGSYIRLGPLERTRLGVGQVVSFHNTLAAWNDRRIGAEATVSSPNFRLQGFADDLNFTGLIGGTLSVLPFGNRINHPLRKFSLFVGAVKERKVDLVDDERPFNSISAGGRIEAWRSGAFSLFPFASYTRLDSGKEGIMIGADASSDNFIDTARLHFRLAFHINSEGFTPGIVGPFWQVHNAQARIIESDREDETAAPVLIARDFVTAPNNRVLETELRLLLFERFELWYRFMKNFDHTSAGQFNARIFVRARQFRFALSYDRGGVEEFLALFDNLEDLTLVRFETSYQIFNLAWILIEARYTYDRIPLGGEIRLYEVERRFDPLVGVRILL